MTAKISQTQPVNPSTRDLLIALNSHPAMMRSAICSLSVDPSLWSRLRSGDVAAAGQLGVPVKQLNYALEILPRAQRLADREKRRAEQAEARIFTRLDAEYPSELLDHPLPPPVLYCRGMYSFGKEELPTPTHAVGIVGSRRCDGYGREVADHLATELARAGVAVISGFAKGIDQAAHRGAVDARGVTVAVLGCGLDVDYPKNSRPLARGIEEHGCLLSEFPMGREPRNWHFPIRNRVIAALSSGVIVVQAKPRSGSLITAHAALELGRDVFAVPGRIFDELSQGTNGLLADGAVPVTCADDVLGHVHPGWQRRTAIHKPSTSASLEPAKHEDPVEDLRPLPKGTAGKVVVALPEGGAGRTAEDLATELGLSVDRLLGVLLELELSGWIQRFPGPLYCR